MGTIVLGYVAKPEGDAALARAVAEAKLRGASLIIVNTQSHSEPDLEMLELSGVSYVIRSFSPDVEVADELVGIAHDHEAELIVIGLRRRSPVGKLILGSSAQRILLDAQCPVLAVKADSR
jgi:Universal stress protein family